MRSVCVRSLSQTNGPFGEYKLHYTSGNLVFISPQLIHCIDKRNNEQECLEFEKLNTIINLPSVCYVSLRNKRFLASSSRKLEREEKIKGMTGEGEGNFAPALTFAQ